MNTISQIPVILGPTACGKTSVAARLAFELDGEVISADSRQVYRGMTLGTGKDLSEFTVEGKNIPYHLIDIADPLHEYNIFEYQRDFSKAINDIAGRGKLPVLCGGSGMYLEAVLKGYDLPQTSPDPSFSGRMSTLTDAELLQELRKRKRLHSTTDTSDRERMIRALGIEEAREMQKTLKPAHDPRPSAGGSTFAALNPVPGSRAILFGINPGREEVRKRITSRLKVRLDAGMLNEVKKLLDDGVPPARLKSFGLEYKFTTLHLEGMLTYDEMFRLLNTAIHQFAKRQMTWFRRMERQGMVIHWLDPDTGLEDKTREIREKLLQFSQNSGS